MENKHIKLVYIGKMVIPGCCDDMRMWNIIHPGNPFHLSSRTLNGLKELGIVPNKGDN